MYDALKNHKIYAAGLDVLNNKTIDNPLLQLDNIVFSPREGYLTDGSIKNMAEMVIQNAEAFAKGNPINLEN